MLTEERVAALQAVLEDEAVTTEIEKAVTFAEIQKVFAARGVQITEEEFNEIAATLTGDASELSEESLDDVAGGVIGKAGRGLLLNPKAVKAIVKAAKVISQTLGKPGIRSFLTKKK